MVTNQVGYWITQNKPLKLFKNKYGITRQADDGKIKIYMWVNNLKASLEVDK